MDQMVPVATKVPWMLTNGAISKKLCEEAIHLSGVYALDIIED